MSTECAYLWYDYLIMESHEMIVGSNLLEGAMFTFSVRPAKQIATDKN